jgi:adenosylmethionine-8-amino-7-oxononanoate aminotransferase
MKDFIKKLQKDLKNLETAVKKDSDELLKKVKSYATKENLTAAGVEIEKILEKKLKEFEPTINKVVGEIRKNAAKAGINVDNVESTVRSTVKKAAATVRSAAEKRGFDVDKTMAKVKTAAKSAAETAKKKAEPVTKKVVSKVKKAKSPSTKAATVRRPKTSKKKSGLTK